MSAEQKSDVPEMDANTQRKEAKKKLYESHNKEALECRMYKNEWPAVDDIVMVEVKKLDDAVSGAYCSLLEYNNMEGMLLYSELQRKRIRSVKGVIKAGRNETVVVVKVNKEKGYIDLSRKRVIPEEKDKLEIKWNKSKTVHSIFKQLSTQLSYKYSVEELYQMFGWKIYHKFGHAFDGLKLLMSDRQLFLSILNDKIEFNPALLLPNPQLSNDSQSKSTQQKPTATQDDDTTPKKESCIPDDVSEIFFSIVEKRLKPTPQTIRALVEVTCFTKHGINAIRDALKHALSENNSEQCQVSIKLVAPPDFNISVDTYDAALGIAVVKRCIDSIDKSIKSFGGSCTVKEEPRVITERNMTEIGMADEDEDDE